jgi:hypothetical protein
MRALTAAEILVVWERGAEQSAAERAVTMLAAACPEPADALARLPIGQRDARLLSLRERTLGPRLTSVSECPGCGQTLELELTTDDLRAEDGHSSDDGEPVIVHVDGFEARFRLPNTFDLLAAAEARDVAGARRLLIERCALSARDEGGAEVPASALGVELLSSAASHMSAADPQADVQLALTCPDCGHDWLAPFDIAVFFWTELQACARRLVLEIHELASTYGWSEASILAMSAVRREAYLDRVRA